MAQVAVFMRQKRERMMRVRSELTGTREPRKDRGEKGNSVLDGSRERKMGREDESEWVWNENLSI